MAVQKYSTREALNLYFGGKGYDVISDTSGHTGVWVEITAVDAAASLATLTTSVGDDFDGEDLPQNETIRAPITKIHLTSGKVYAKRG